MNTCFCLSGVLGNKDFSVKVGIYSFNILKPQKCKVPVVIFVNVLQQQLLLFKDFRYCIFDMSQSFFLVMVLLEDAFTMFSVLHKLIKPSLKKSLEVFQRFPPV